MQYLHGNIPYMFARWANPVVHLLTAKEFHWHYLSFLACISSTGKGMQVSVRPLSKTSFVDNAIMQPWLLIIA